MPALLLVPFFGFLMYFLYQRGYVCLSSKRALAFIGSKRAKSATFTACSGKISRVLRPTQSRSYSFQFDADLSKGSVQAELRDKGRTLLFTLDGEHPQAFVNLEKGKAYTLTIRFHAASGRYALDWT